MSADIKTSWEQARVDKLKPRSLYMTKVEPVLTNYPELSGLVYCDHGAPGRLEIPIAMQWASFESLDKEIILKYFAEGERNLGFTGFNNHIRAVQTVLGVRNLAAFGQTPGFDRKLLWTQSLDVKKEGGYRLYRKHGIGVDRRSQLLLTNWEGDKVAFGDIWNDMIKPIFRFAFDPKGKVPEMLDGYSRRFFKAFKLRLEPVNYDDWKKQVADSLTV